MRKLIPAFLLTLVNVLGFSILIPILPFIVEELGGTKFTYGLLISTYSIFQFFGAPVLGSLSDTYGRRPILLISQAGTLLSWFVFMAAYFLPPDLRLFGFALPLIVIFLSRVFDGVTGGNISTTNAYVSDLTTAKEKAQKFGLIGAVFGVGMIVGPALGGISAGTSYGWLGTVVLAILISAITLFSIWKYLPESLAKENRKPKRNLNLWEQLNIVKKIKKFSRDKIMANMLLIRLLFGLVMAGYTSIIVLYLIDLFDFNPTEIGFFLLFVGSFLIFNQGVMVNKFVQRFGESITMLIGHVLTAFGIVAITLTDKLWLFIVFYYFMNLGLALLFSSAQALLVNNVDKTQQGEITGLDQSIGSFCAAIAPALAGLSYMLIGEKTFWIFTVFLIFGTLLSWRIVKLNTSTQ